MTKPATYRKKAASDAGTTGPFSFTITVTATKQSVENIINAMLKIGLTVFDGDK